MRFNYFYLMGKYWWKDNFQIVGKLFLRNILRRFYAKNKESNSAKISDWQDFYQ